jgi:hypothetical protein
MQSTITLLALITAVILVGLILISLYSQNSAFTIAQDTLYKNAMELSQSLTYSISPFTFNGYNSNLFNITFFLWINIPQYNGKIVLIPFVTSASYNVYNALPSYSSQQASIKGYNPVNLNSPKVLLPQGQSFYLGNLKAFIVPNNGVYQISANVTKGQIIVIWIVANLSGNLFRLAYPYINPFAGGVGSYVVSGTNSYIANNTYLDNTNQPIYLSSNPGFSFGIWFNVINPPINITLINATDLTGNREYTLIWINIDNNKNLNLYSYYSKSKSLNVIPITKIILNNWYYLNFSIGAQFSDTLTVYDQNRNLITSTTIQKNFIDSSFNGYGVTISFGNTKSLQVLISQAYILTPKSNAYSALYNVSNYILQNGYLFNNTQNMKKLVNIWSNMNPNPVRTLIYWCFVVNYYPPPSYTYAFIWWLVQNQQTYNFKILPPNGPSSWYFIG